MTGRIPIAALLAALWLAGAGCASAPREIRPARVVPVVLESGNKVTEVSAQVAEELKLELPRVEKPGFRWQVFAQDTRFLKQTSEVTPTPGVSGGSSVTFLVLQSASRPTKIRFLLVREDKANESTPVDIHDVIVTIQ